MKLHHLVILVVVAWLSAAFGMWLWLPDWPTRGQFGDLFGAVNALFSGLAFAGLYSALKLQQSQLELQRTELSLQREELRMQREEMTASRLELANQVRAQQSLVKATNAQIAVASAQARIEAIKLNSEQFVPGARGDFAKQIDSIADAMSALCNKLESECQ